MIKSSFFAGKLIVNALQRSDMLDVSSYGISVERLLTLLDECNLDVITEHFETDKEMFYEPRPVVATRNFKFASGNPTTVGSGTISSTGTAVIGSGTLFTTQAVVGDYIYAAGQLRKIVTITDALNIVIDSAFSPDLPLLTTYKVGALATYDSATKRITLNMEIGVASVKDEGKVILFFDGSQSTNVGYAGKIVAFIAGTPSIYEIVPFFPPPSTLKVIDITVGDWLVTGDVIRLIQPNEILSPENIELYDLTNNQSIDVVPYEEFHRRMKLTMYSQSKQRWARYMKTTIEFSEGSNAVALGTVKVSAYWMPPKSVSFNSPVYNSDKRIPEIEERLALKLLSIKSGQIIPQPSVTDKELQTTALRDRNTQEDIEKVR